jgi:hypothetical protein
MSAPFDSSVVAAKSRRSWNLIVSGNPAFVNSSLINGLEQPSVWARDFLPIRDAQTDQVVQEVGQKAGHIPARLDLSASAVSRADRQLILAAPNRHDTPAHAKRERAPGQATTAHARRCRACSGCGTRSGSAGGARAGTDHPGDQPATLRIAGEQVWVVEQNARQILRFASHAYVLENGALTLGGCAADLAADPVVQQIYMGHAATAL